MQEFVLGTLFCFEFLNCEEWLSLSSSFLSLSVSVMVSGPRVSRSDPYWAGSSKAHNVLWARPIESDICVVQISTATLTCNRRNRQYPLPSVFPDTSNLPRSNTFSALMLQSASLLYSELGFRVRSSCSSKDFQQNSSRWRCLYFCLSES
ncbi:unnamed protein product [Rhodiola kirilowii]